MPFKIYPYKMSSQSAKYLSEGLDCTRVYPNRRYIPKSNHVIINWGNSHRPDWYRRSPSIINEPECVRDATNKLTTLLVLKEAGVNVPEFTTVIAEAKAWDGIVVCRRTITGARGQGIVIANNPDEIIDAPLYTKHLRHKHEYRVHMMNGEVIDVTQKKKRQGTNPNSLVRSHGDWVFCREGIVIPDVIKEQALKAVSALGLDFGAVDIAYRERENKAYALEINTAPGLDAGSITLAKYIEGFRRHYEI
jgi:hypothetical protein